MYADAVLLQRVARRVGASTGLPLREFSRGYYHHIAFDQTSRIREVITLLLKDRLLVVVGKVSPTTLATVWHTRSGHGVAAGGVATEAGAFGAGGGPGEACGGCTVGAVSSVSPRLPAMLTRRSRS